MAKEMNILEGDLDLLKPNFKITPRSTVKLENIGVALTGLYYVESSTISLTQEGVEQSLSLSRNGFTDTVKQNNVVIPTKNSVAKPSKNTNKKKPTVSKKTKTHTVKRGETLSSISKKYYGTANKYMKIYNANKSKLKSPNRIYPGQKLTIP